MELKADSCTLGAANPVALHAIENYKVPAKNPGKRFLVGSEWGTTHLGKDIWGGAGEGLHTLEKISGGGAGGGVHTLELEADGGTLGAANPVALHVFDALGPI